MLASKQFTLRQLRDRRGKAVEHAAKLVIEEREWFTNLKEAKAGALSALSDTVDMFSATITQADEEELWGFVVQAVMDERKTPSTTLKLP